MSLLTMACVVVGGGVECSDHRISLAEFLEMQEQMVQQVAASQPAEVDPQTRALIDERLGSFKAGPSDVLVITLTSLDEGVTFPSVEARVDRNGEIDLPAVGRLNVAGLELEDIEKKIQEAFVPAVYREAVVLVRSSEVDTTNVLVTGAVTTAGLIPLRRNERNLLYAIVGAGGVTQDASGRVTLRRVRRPGEEASFKLTDPVEFAAALSIDPLEDGDILKVEAATPNTIYVGGLVQAPRPQVYPAGVRVTVLQAIAASAGLRTDVWPKEATLMRRMSNGEDVQVKLDLDRLARGEDPNITLAAGDILWVPETIETRIQDWINRNVFFRVGATVTGNVNYNATAVEYMNSNARQAAIGGAQGARTLQDQFDPFGFLVPPPVVAPGLP